MTTASSDDRPTVSVRPAERADLLAVYRIETDAFPQPWPFGAFEQYLGQPGFLVAADDAVHGYIVADRVRDRGRLVGHIKNLAVHEAHRRQGFGKLLLTRGIDLLRSQGAELVKLEVRESNGPALDLYRSYEFEHRATVDGYYNDGEDALLLVREL
ncbi:ribosomal protein S18-alanine N-acetyltransferase [Halobacteriaceae archaeon SHR40]|uniref:ribosomal protein S18-alanine N-acetyltransferase n=1 Tax=Halovenus amylolytica TaxID=2500550 RepID=UPI000FE33AE0